MGKSSFLVGKLHFLIEKLHFPMGVLSFLHGKSGFLMEKLPFLMEKSCFLMGILLFLMEKLHFTAGILLFPMGFPAVSAEVKRLTPVPAPRKRAGAGYTSITSFNPNTKPPETQKPEPKVRAFACKYMRHPSINPSRSAYWFRWVFSCSGVSLNSWQSW